MCVSWSPGTWREVRQSRPSTPYHNSTVTEHTLAVPEHIVLLTHMGLMVTPEVGAVINPTLRSR